MNHYLITGFGGSGTKFLAQMLDKSMYFSAYHEHCKEWAKEEKAKDFYQARIKSHDAVALSYADVNSHMRNIMLANLGIRVLYIDRKPEELLMSWYPHKREKWAESKSEENRWFESLEKWLHTRAILHKHHLANRIDFWCMVNDGYYLQNLLYELGAHDVRVTAADLEKKINSHNKGRIKHYLEVPEQYRQRLNKIMSSV